MIQMMRHHCSTSDPVANQHGYTLIELMVTIAILAILLTIAVPSFTSVINSNRLEAQASEIAISLQSARSEALRLNRSVSVCRSTNGSTCAGAGQWDSWITLLPGNNALLRNAYAKAPVQVTSAVSAVTFGADGLARESGQLLSTSITACIPTSRPAENQRIVNIVAGGIISIESANGSGSCE